MKNIKEVTEMRFRQLLTVEQVSQMFGYIPNSFINQFSRTAKAIEKKFNVVLAKVTTTQGVRYYLQQPENDKNSELSIYTTKNKLYITEQSLQFETYQFFVFLTVIAATTYGVYRGTKNDLLKFIGLKSTKKNIELLTAAIQSLVKKGYIQEVKDEDYEILFIKREIEKKINISVTMLQECRRIVEQNNKQFKKLSQLIQVWEAVRLCEQHQPFTYAELQKITGLSYYQIREIKKLLETNNVFISSRAGSYLKCLGMNVDLNVFYVDNRNAIIESEDK